MKKVTRQKNNSDWQSLLSDFVKYCLDKIVAHTKQRPTKVSTRKQIRNTAPTKHVEKTTLVTKPIIQVKKTKPFSTTKFLSFPIEKDARSNVLTPYTAETSAVLDHSGTPIDPTAGNNARWHNDTNEVKAFNGETGNFKKFKEEKHAGFSQKSGLPFLVKEKINYVGVSSQGSNKYLQYDGHSGYDYRYPVKTPLVAPADGYLSKAINDFVNGKGRQATAWEQWHTFYIKHPNGFLTYFLHCKELQDEIEKQIGNDYQKTVQVVKGQPIAFTGDFGYGKHGGIPAHLHFEVRDENDNIVDPYKDCLWVE